MLRYVCILCFYGLPLAVELPLLLLAVVVNPDYITRSSRGSGVFLDR